MSVNTILSNPRLLSELAAAIGGGGTVGISEINSTDGNLVVTQVGTVVDISFASAISVVDLSATSLQASSSDFTGPMSLSGSVGTTGQVLTSGGSGVPPTWTTVGGGGGGITSIVSGDGNLSISEAAGVVDISFSPSLTLGDVGIVGTISLGEPPNAGTDGQILTSTGTAAAWVSGGMRFVDYHSAAVDAGWTGPGTTILGRSINVSKPGNRLLVMLNISYYSDVGTQSLVTFTAATGPNSQSQTSVIVYALAQAAPSTYLFSFDSDPLGGDAQELSISFVAQGGYDVRFNSSTTYSVLTMELLQSGL